MAGVASSLSFFAAGLGGGHAREDFLALDAISAAVGGAATGVDPAALTVTGTKTGGGAGGSSLAVGTSAAEILFD